MRIFTISCKVGELMEKLRKNQILFEFLIGKQYGCPETKETAPYDGAA